MTTLTATSTSTSGLSRERRTAEQPTAHAAASDPEKWREALASVTALALAPASALPLQQAVLLKTASPVRTTGPGRVAGARHVEAPGRVDAPAATANRVSRSHGRDRTANAEPEGSDGPVGTALRAETRESAPGDVTDAAAKDSPIPTGTARGPAGASGAGKGGAAPVALSGLASGAAPAANGQQASGRQDAAGGPVGSATAAADARMSAAASPDSLPGEAGLGQHGRGASPMAHDAKTPAHAHATGGTEAIATIVTGAPADDAATVSLVVSTATAADHPVAHTHEAIAAPHGDRADAGSAAPTVSGGSSAAPVAARASVATPAPSSVTASPMAPGVQAAVVSGTVAVHPVAARGAGGAERVPDAVAPLGRTKAAAGQGSRAAGTSVAAAGENLAVASHAAAGEAVPFKGGAEARVVRAASRAEAWPWSPELEEGQAPQDPLAAALRGGANPSWRMRLDGGPLGPLGVHVEARHAMVAAHFQAQPDTAALLRQTADQLAGGLAQQGLSLAQFGVNDQAWHGASRDRSADPELGRAGAAARSTAAGFSRGGVTLTSAIPGPREWQM